MWLPPRATDNPEEVKEVERNLLRFLSINASITLGFLFDRITLDPGLPETDDRVRLCTLVLDYLCGQALNEVIRFAKNRTVTAAIMFPRELHNLETSSLVYTGQHALLLRVWAALPGLGPAKKEKIRRDMLMKLPGFVETTPSQRNEVLEGLFGTETPEFTNLTELFEATPPFLDLRSLLTLNMHTSPPDGILERLDTAYNLPISSLAERDLIYLCECIRIALVISDNGDQSLREQVIRAAPVIRKV